MTSSIFKRHPAKSHAFRQFSGEGRSPCSCKIAKSNFDVQELKQGGILGEKEYLKKSENKYKKQLSKQAKKDKAINKSNTSSFHLEDEI